MSGGHTLGPSSGRHHGSRHPTTVEMSSRLHPSPQGVRPHFWESCRTAACPGSHKVPGGAELNGTPGAQSLLCKCSLHLTLFLALLHTTWDLHFQTRDRTCAPCIGSAVLITGPPGKFLPLPTSPHPSKTRIFLLQPSPQQKAASNPSCGQRLRRGR